MAEYKLSCCSTADLPAEYFKERDILVSFFHCNINGNDYPDDMGKTLPFETFYKMVREGALPTTSQVNIEQYIERWEPGLKQGIDILHLTLSTGISGTYTSACAARDELAEKYPDRKIYVVDSLAASSGYGLLMDILYEKKHAGADIDTLHDWVEENKLCMNHWVLVSDLSHLKRGGRVSGTAAAIGTILSICPIIEVDVNGRLEIRRKVRGKKQAIQDIVREMEARAVDGLAYSGKCFISNSDCKSDARAVADKIEEKFPKLNGRVQIFSIGTVIGSHTGCGTIALFFEGAKRNE